MGFIVSEPARNNTHAHKRLHWWTQKSADGESQKCWKVIKKKYTDYYYCYNYKIRTHAQTKRGEEDLLRMPEQPVDQSSMGLLTEQCDVTEWACVLGDPVNRFFLSVSNSDIFVGEREVKGWMTQSGQSLCG